MEGHKMAKKKEKIAVFVSGPMRFVDLLNISLNDVLSNIEYDCFYHIWTDDFGNKIRTGYSAVAHYKHAEILMSIWKVAHFYRFLL